MTKEFTPLANLYYRIKRIITLASTIIIKLRRDNNISLWAVLNTGLESQGLLVVEIILISDFSIVLSTFDVFLLMTGMLGYGMAKAAVHQLVKGLAAENGGLPAAASVLAILP